MNIESGDMKAARRISAAMKAYATKNNLTKGTMKLTFNENEYKTILSKQKIEKTSRCQGFFYTKSSHSRCE